MSIFIVTVTRTNYNTNKNRTQMSEQGISLGNPCFRSCLRDDMVVFYTLLLQDSGRLFSFSILL